MVSPLPEEKPVSQGPPMRPRLSPRERNRRQVSTWQSSVLPANHPAKWSDPGRKWGPGRVSDRLKVTQLARGRAIPPSHGGNNSPPPPAPTRREGAWPRVLGGGKDRRPHLAHVLELLLLLHAQRAGSLQQAPGPLLGRLLQVTELLAVSPRHLLLLHDLLALGHRLLQETVWISGGLPGALAQLPQATQWDPPTMWLRPSC